jgi:hypothetical protein
VTDSNLGQHSSVFATSGEARNLACKKTGILKLCRMSDRLSALAHAKIAGYTSVATPGLGGSFFRSNQAVRHAKRGMLRPLTGSAEVSVRSGKLGRSNRAGHESEDGMD